MPERERLLRGVRVILPPVRLDIARQGHLLQRARALKMQLWEPKAQFLLHWLPLKATEWQWLRLPLPLWLDENLGFPVGRRFLIRRREFRLP